MTTPLEATTATAKSVNRLGTKFMLDFDVFGRMAEHGYSGLDFYFCGRGGALGDTNASVAAAAFAFFPNHAVEAMWNQGVSVRPASATFELYLEECARWGREHFGADIDYEDLAGLAAKIVNNAPTTSMALFAGWKQAPLPNDAKGAAMISLVALRELRGGAHAAAITTAGISPFEAVVATGGPDNAKMLGYSEPFPEVDHLREAMEHVELTTNQIVALGYEALESDELDRFVELTNAAYAGLR